MNEKDDNKQNRTHELLHTLFFDHDDAQQGIGHYPPQKITQDDINTLINNSNLPAVKKEKKKDEQHN